MICAIGTHASPRLAAPSPASAAVAPIRLIAAGLDSPPSSELFHLPRARHGSLKLTVEFAVQGDRAPLLLTRRCHAAGGKIKSIARYYSQCPYHGDDQRQAADGNDCHAAVAVPIDRSCESSDALRKGEGVPGMPAGIVDHVHAPFRFMSKPQERH